ncbi:MarR family winged helix-turn-helix transcriptional regulator [Hippea maritima]|uniref:Regulatory protein MarR n=1 Tax=Hippea maritima (strain ATCC 700847 / DSM 10411 / MH2) TaxID=760142 RepID=F2LUI8_HIPMA|nr:MarR family winged helix-turn-helix transcriptional regulator [Hippea maritima]AEA34578.1 regulatory protein MarR [Hippea maritima DSM 10411]
MSVYIRAKELILGSRLKRLSDRFLNEVSVIYKSQNIPFEPSWFAIFYILDRHGKTTISQLAYELDLTQSAISQTISILENKGLIKVGTQKGDKRIKVLELTEDAFKLLLQVKPLWKLIKAKMREVLNEGENSKYLLEALDELEISCQRKSLSQRVLEELSNIDYSIVADYRGEFYLQLKRLFFNWMFNFGCIKSSLVNDFKDTLKKSKLLFALKDREAVACVLGVEEKAETLVFVCDKDDVDNRIAAELFLRFIGQFSLKKAKVYLDADKPLIIKILAENGFRKVATEEKTDVNKRLAIFERG